MPNKHQSISQTDKLDLAIRTQTEVAEIMTQRGYPMGKSAVYAIETRALQKIKIGLSAVAKDFGYDQKGGEI